MRSPCTCSDSSVEVLNEGILSDSSDPQIVGEFLEGNRNQADNRNDANTLNSNGTAFPKRVPAFETSATSGLPTENNGNGAYQIPIWLPPPFGQPFMQPCYPQPLPLFVYPIFVYPVLVQNQMDLFPMYNPGVYNQPTNSPPLAQPIPAEPPNCATLPPEVPNLQQDLQFRVNPPSEVQHLQSRVSPPLEIQHLQSRVSPPLEIQDLQYRASSLSEVQHVQCQASPPLEIQDLQCQASPPLEMPDLQSRASPPLEIQDLQFRTSPPLEMPDLQSRAIPLLEIQDLQSRASSPSVMPDLLPFDAPSEISDSLHEFCKNFEINEEISENPPNSTEAGTNGEIPQDRSPIPEIGMDDMHLFGPCHHSIQKALNLNENESWIESEDERSDDFQEPIRSNGLETLQVPANGNFPQVTKPEVLPESVASVIDEPLDFVPTKLIRAKKQSKAGSQTVRRMKNVSIAQYKSVPDGANSVETSTHELPASTSQSMRAGPSSNKENVPVKLVRVSAELAKEVTNFVVFPPNNEQLLKKQASPRKSKGRKRKRKSNNFKKSSARPEYLTDDETSPALPPKKRRGKKPAEASSLPHNSDSLIEKSPRRRSVRLSKNAQRSKKIKGGTSDSDFAGTDDEQEVQITSRGRTVRRVRKY